jgi:hypothetical protein
MIARYGPPLPLAGCHEFGSRFPDSKKVDDGEDEKKQPIAEMKGVYVQRYASFPTVSVRDLIFVSLDTAREALGSRLDHEERSQKFVASHVLIAFVNCLDGFVVGVGKDRLMG